MLIWLLPGVVVVWQKGVRLGVARIVEGACRLLDKGLEGVLVKHRWSGLHRCSEFVLVKGIRSRGEAWGLKLRRWLLKASGRFELERVTHIKFINRVFL